MQKKKKKTYSRPLLFDLKLELSMLKKMEANILSYLLVVRQSVSLMEVSESKVIEM